MNQLHIKGHSNFTLDLLQNDQGYYVKKKSQQSDAHRLKKQSKKQSDFEELIRQDALISHFLEVPKVLREEHNEDGYHFMMRYYKGESILSHVETGDIFYLENLMERIFLFVRWCFEHSPKVELDKSVLVQKLQDIQSKTTDEHIREIIEKEKNHLLGLQKSIVIPVGYCHGDLTFSNIIFSHKIVLIDFLDSFIETPLQDIAKILQEINLQWTFLMEDDAIDKTKINIGYNHLKKFMELEIGKIVRDFEIDRETIDLFYLMTLLRIVPYAKEEKIKTKLFSEIQRQSEVLPWNKLH